MICTLCRSTVPADALVCPICGDLVQVQVELGTSGPSSGYSALWIILGLIGLIIALIVMVVRASGEPVDTGAICVAVLLLALVLAPGMLTHGRGRALLATLGGRAPRRGLRDLTYLKHLRTESTPGNSRPSIHYFATFAALAEFNIEREQYEQLKGCEGQRMVITYLPEYHALVEFVPAPPAG